MLFTKPKFSRREPEIFLHFGRIFAAKSAQSTHYLVAQGLTSTDRAQRCVAPRNGSLLRAFELSAVDVSLRRTDRYRGGGGGGGGGKGGAQRRYRHIPPSCARARARARARKVCLFGFCRCARNRALNSLPPKDLNVAPRCSALVARPRGDSNPLLRRELRPLRPNLRRGNNNPNNPFSHKGITCGRANTPGCGWRGGLRSLRLNESLS